MLTVEHMKESLSRAYVQAIAGCCGLSCSYREFDYGFDCTLHHIQVREKRYVESGFKLDIQAKCTERAEHDGGVITYDLEAKNYGDLRDPRAGCPRILVLLCVPPDKSDWLIQDASGLTCRKCAYWLNLRDSPDLANERTVRVRIPETQVF